MYAALWRSGESTVYIHFGRRKVGLEFVKRWFCFLGCKIVQTESFTMASCFAYSLTQIWRPNVLPILPLTFIEIHDVISWKEKKNVYCMLHLLWKRLWFVVTYRCRSLRRYQKHETLYSQLPYSYASGQFESDYTAPFFRKVACTRYQVSWLLGNMNFTSGWKYTSVYFLLKNYHTIIPGVQNACWLDIDSHEL
jgi:hypothetical protein